MVINDVTSDLIVISGLIIVILSLLWQIGRESEANKRTHQKAEREAISRIVRDTRKKSSSDEVNEFRNVILEKIQNRNS